MKKCIVVIAALIISIGAFLPLYANSGIVKSGDKSGKWVPVYGGGSSPAYCKCVSSFWHSKCFVGDISSDLSLCE